MMESATTTRSNGAREWKTFETNWTISGGSLESSVTVESSSSTSIADEDVQSESSKHRSPLVLSPSPDSNPCEITITFTGRYEVHQVYVRSTARVYEIYYKTKVQNHNEYLCTVRCGVAAKDTCVTAGIIDDCLTYIRDSEDHPSAEERAKTEGHSNASEDDWVEVKALSATCITEKDNSTRISWHNMDFYEATAQIADVDPCISLTIRLVSIQSGECVYVDEVYVFSDPVDSDVESQDGKVENSAGSSLMAMLVPTLLQLSKRTDSTNEKDDKHSYDLAKRKQLLELGSGSGNLNMHPIASSLSNTTNNTTEGSEDEAKCNTTDHREAQTINSEPTQQITQGPVSGSKLDHIEGILEQLASRIVRIEDICLRFEEKMLKPISSIEARLQSVEQQLEMLNDKSQKGLQSCNKFSAPECSFSESNINSPLKDVTSCHEAVGSGKDSSDGSSIPVDDVHVSASTSQLVPSLAIVAPIFSEDENEERIPEQKVDSPERNPRPAVSLDDALAFALAGFMSSTLHFNEYAQPLTVKSLDVQNEADDIYEQQALPKNSQSEFTDFCAHLKGADGKEHKEGSGTSTNEAFLERFDYYNYSEEVSLESNETQPLENGKYNLLQTEGDITSDAAKEEAIRVELIEDEKANPESNQNPVDGASGTPISVSLDATLNDTKGTVMQQDIERFDGFSKMTTVRSDSAETSCELSAADKTVASMDGPYVEGEAAQPSTRLSVPIMKSKSEADTAENVFIFSQPASAVDFSIPILDVKFISQGISNESPLEALLSDMPESNTTPCDEHCHDACAYEEQPNLIVVDDADPMCATDSNLTENFDYDDLEEIPAGDSENLQANFACGYKELLSGSLI